jgi:predicted MPP superfamily phosphohydrolase
MYHLVGTPGGVEHFVEHLELTLFPLDRYQVGPMTLYTNRGLGSNMWWIRVNCPPEIALVTLRSSRREA